MSRLVYGAQTGFGRVGRLGDTPQGLALGGEDSGDVQDDDELVAALAHALDEFGLPAEPEMGRFVDRSKPVKPDDCTPFFTPLDKIGLNFRELSNSTTFSPLSVVSLSSGTETVKLEPFFIFTFAITTGSNPLFQKL